MRGRIKTQEDIARSIADRSMPIPECGCIIWLGPLTPKGYGQTTWNFKHRPVHRLAYELAKGPVPDGLVLDHKCRVRSCCNPDHLEPVTNRENIRRGTGHTAVNARKTHCSEGHPLSGDNLELRVSAGTMRRRCIKCRKAESARYEKKRVRPSARESA